MESIFLSYLMNIIVDNFTIKKKFYISYFILVDTSSFPSSNHERCHSGIMEEKNFTFLNYRKVFERGC